MNCSCDFIINTVYHWKDFGGTCDQCGAKIELLIPFTGLYVGEYMGGHAFRVFPFSRLCCYSVTTQLLIFCEEQLDVTEELEELRVNK